MNPLVLPFIRRTGRSHEGLHIVAVKSSVWKKLGWFDHVLPDHKEASRRTSKEFAEWIEDSVKGEIFYDAQFFDGDRARWIMLFTEVEDAVAFKLRWT